MYFSTACFLECIFQKYIFPENIFSKCILPKLIFQSEFFQCVFSKVFFFCKNVHDLHVFFALQVYFQLVNIDVREGIKTYSYTLLHFSLTCYLDLHNMTKGREWNTYETQIGHWSGTRARDKGARWVLLIRRKKGKGQEAKSHITIEQVHNMYLYYICTMSIPKVKCT